MSWEQLHSIYQDAAKTAQQEDQAPPTACPHDGEPLRTGPDGSLFCPWGDYKYTGAHDQRAD